MGKLTKNLVWMVFTLVLVGTLLPIHGMCVEAATTMASGTCGAEGNEENVTWVYDSDNVLTISGSGAMADYSTTGIHQSAGDTPWYRYRNQTKKIVIKQGVTSIGDYAFAEMHTESLVFPTSSLTKIGTGAFAYTGGYKEVILPDSLTDLGYAAFYISGGISKVYIPGSISVLPDFAFTHLSSAVVEIGSGCTTISNYSLEGSISKLVLPSTITSIDPSSFGSSVGVTAVYTTSSIAKTFFENRDVVCLENNKSYVLDENMIEVYETSILYTGAEIKPMISVQYKNNELAFSLVENEDYTLTYENNVNVGMASVKVIGKGCYSGSVTKNYQIYNTIDNCDVTLEYESVLYDGTAKCPTVVVKCGNKTLTKDIDYIVAYASNTDEGTASVTISGKGDYKGTKEKTYSIYKNDFSVANVSLEYENVKYDGNKKEPTIAVSYKGKSLTLNRDYTIKYINNIVPGIAKVQISGMGQYSGIVEKSFEIIGLSLENADVQLKESIYSYDGSPKTPPVTVKLGDKTLVKDTDYTLTYEDNVNDGTAYAVVTGIGIYTDIVKVSFVILPYNAGMDSVYPDGTLIDGNFVYGVTDDEALEVELCCPATKNLSKVQIPASIKDEAGVTYKVTSIGQKAFYKNTKITSLVIGNNIKSIEDYAFYGCKNVSKINFGKSVEIIGGSSFRKCTKLASITLPKSIDELGKNAFYGCSKLKTITINADTVIDVNANAIKGISKKAVIKVPQKLVKKYKKEFSKKTGYKSSMKIKKK